MPRVGEIQHFLSDVSDGVEVFGMGIKISNGKSAFVTSNGRSVRGAAEHDCGKVRMFTLQFTSYRLVWYSCVCRE